MIVWHVADIDDALFESGICIGVL